MGQFSGNHVFLSPLQQAVRGGVEVVMDTVEGGPLSRYRVPGHQDGDIMRIPQKNIFNRV